MRPSLRLLHAAPMNSAKGLSPGPMALLPPIYLYRRLLRAHRKHLPPEMRLLGDEYVKAEFRAHRNVENPVHLVSYCSFFFFVFFCIFLMSSLFRVRPLFEKGRKRWVEKKCMRNECNRSRGWLPMRDTREWLTDWANPPRTDRVPHRVAAVRAKDRGRFVGRREAGSGQD